MEVAAALIFVAGMVAMDTSSGPQCLISEPVVSCTILGILFGVPETGLKMGVLFQLLWLGYMPLGAARLADGNMGSFIAVASLISASVIYGFADTEFQAAVDIIHALCGTGFAYWDALNHRFEETEQRP